MSDDVTGMGGPEKYNTPERRRQIFDLYKEHRSKGLSKDSFPECDFSTLKDMIARHTDEFKEEELSAIERNYLRFWEQIGIDGAKGGKDFNAPGWIFNMKNRAKWKDRQEVVGDSENPFEVKISIIE